jgi:CRISPR-associated endoribonuclease Cas6
MHYVELRCTAYLKRDITFKNSFEILSKYISFSMAQDRSLKKLHESDRFKHYSFGGLYPTERSKIYQQGKTYTFTLRAFDERFVVLLQKRLRENINNPYLQIVEIQKKRHKQFFISELYSLTPVIVTVERGLYWTIQRDGDIVKLQKQLHDNLEKKYQEFFKEEIKASQNFIQLLEVKNRFPQSIYMAKNKKDVRFLGNKFRIVPHEDEISQKLAFVALACGLGEKSSFGGGFCLGK